MKPIQAIKPAHQPTLSEIPIEKWLAPKEVAGHFGLKEDSAESWIADGTVPRELIRFCGRRRIRVHPSALRILERIFENAHE